MARYTFHSSATVSVSTTVEADSLAEALEEALSRQGASYCHSCTVDDDHWTADEIDGSPDEKTLTAECDGSDIPAEALHRALNPKRGRKQVTRE